MELTKRSWNVRAGRLARVVAFALACSAPALVAAANAVVEPVENPAPLVLATRKNDMAAARALLAANPRPDVNQRTADGTSALHWAVYHDRRRSRRAAVRRRRRCESEERLRRDADVGGGGGRQREGAAGAAEGGRRRRVPECGWPDGADDHCAHEQRGRRARLLLERGAKVNAREQWRGQTALMWAAAESQPAMVRLLVEHGAEVNARSSVNEWERQVTAEPRMQARPSGGFTPLLYAARKGCLGVRADSRQGGRRRESRRPRRGDAAAAGGAQLQFRCRRVPRAAGRRRRQVGHLGPVAAVRGGGREHPADGWPRRPALARQDERPRAHRACCSNAGANPNLQLKLFPPYRSLRDDRGADGMLSVGTTPLRARGQSRRRRGDASADLARGQCRVADGHGHHTVDGCFRQRLRRASTRAGATSPKHRPSRPWKCC